MAKIKAGEVVELHGTKFVVLYVQTGERAAKDLARRKPDRSYKNVQGQWCVLKLWVDPQAPLVPDYFFQ